MSDSWGTQELAQALPAAGTNPDAPAEGIDPSAHGWVKPEAYNYDKYLMSNKDSKEADGAAKAAFEAAAAENALLPSGLSSGEDWAGNAPIYEWKGEYGDVGPRFPDIEAVLFGNEEANPAAINFDNIDKIQVIQEGTVRIEPISKFEEANLHPAMLENVKLARYTKPTPIQRYTLPAIEKGHDIIACAQTGSGKTAAFLIPIFNKLMGKTKKLAAYRPSPTEYDPSIHGQIRAEPLVLIVCPTRELATQIFDEARKLAYRTMLRPVVVYGGGPIAEQVGQMAKGVDILIGTPGRLIDFINRPHLLTLSRLKFMVIDEADEMLHSDWEVDLKAIMSGGDQEEGNITYLMFSATFPKSVRDLAKEHLREDHVRIRVGRIGSTHEDIHQDVIFVAPEAKKKALYDLLMSHPPARTIIFVNSKRAADDIDDFLFNKSLPCTSIHADRTQREREDSMRAFRSGKAPILIATGVSARGIDVPNVAHVLNFDLPSHIHGGIEEYTHRIGRTGRAGKKGLATSFYNDRDEDLAVALVHTLLETRQAVPDFLEDKIPEGFTADGKTGDVATLKFEADSGDEDEGDAAEGGGWAAGNNASSETGDAAPADDPFVSEPAVPKAPAAGAWGGDGW